MDADSIHEAKTHFSRLVARAEAGEEIVVRRGATPVAKIVADHAPTTPRVPGALKGGSRSRTTSTRRRTSSPSTPREPAAVDTHALLWWLTDDAGLSETARGRSPIWQTTRS